MSHTTTYFPRVIRARGKLRQWRPSLGCFIGNWVLAAAKAKELRIVHPEATIRRFGGYVNVYL